MWNTLLHFLGVDNPSGEIYAFWSGFGSDIGEFALIGSLFALYRRHKCKMCWRIAAHQVEGTHYKTCHKHLKQDVHNKLRDKHAKRYPEQHALLK